MAVGKRADDMIPPEEIELEDEKVRTDIIMLDLFNAKEPFLDSVQSMSTAKNVNYHLNTALKMMRGVTNASSTVQ